MHNKSVKPATYSVYPPETEFSDEQSDHRGQVNQVPKGSETVLLTEDEPLVLELVARMLSRQGYNVIEAANGNEALRLAGEPDVREINLLFTDMVMPQMGGVKLAAELRVARPKVKVIFASAKVEEEIFEHGLSDGVAFLRKPFMLDDLACKVRDVLDS